MRRPPPISTPPPYTTFSPAAETARRPSALTATPLTELEWPCRVRSSRPVSTSHTFSVLSPEAETARRPSALTATPAKNREAPSRIRVSPRFPHPPPSAVCHATHRPH